MSALKYPGHSVTYRSRFRQFPKKIFSKKLNIEFEIVTSHVDIDEVSVEIIKNPIREGKAAVTCFVKRENQTVIHSCFNYTTNQWIERLKLPFTLTGINDIMNNDVYIECTIYWKGFVNPMPWEIVSKKPEYTGIETMIGKSMFSDLMLEIDGNFIPVHKVILASQSSVMMQILEENDNCQVHQIEGIEFEIMTMVLEYLYGGNVDGLEDSDNAISVYYAALKYNIGPLMALCISHLRKNLCIDNVFKISEMAFKFELDELKEPALDFMKEHKNLLFSEETFHNLNIEVPTVFIDLFKRLL